MVDRFPSVTTTAILEGLRDPQNREAWQQFDDRFRPMIFGMARRLGLGDEDAADATQDVVLAFAQEFRSGRYERGRGRLRHWLIVLTRSRIRDAIRRIARVPRLAGESKLIGEPAPDEAEAAWAAEERSARLRWSLEQLRRRSGIQTKTLRVFEAVKLEGRSPAAVAQELGMRQQGVYLAVSRCMSRFREIFHESADAFADDLFLPDSQRS